MDANRLKTVRRARRKRGIRKRVSGTPDRPRLSVFRSNQRIYAQVIDDVTGRTLAAASSLGTEQGRSVAAASAVGKTLAEKALAAGVKEVSFDRGGYRYHGRVKAMADAARQAGLKF